MLGLFAAKPGHQLADARELRRLLDELPALEPAAALERADAQLDSLVVTEHLKLDHRFGLIVQIDIAMLAQATRLGREYLGAVDLNRVAEFKLWGQNHGYWSRLAAAYAGVLRRYRDDGRAGEALKPVLAQACARLLRACGSQLKWQQFRYGPPADDIWVAAGAAWLTACDAGLERKSVPFGASAPASSVEAEYLRLLLFQASSMDNLLPVEIEIAERLIGHLVPFFKLTEQVHPFNVYWVDPAKPLPPTRLAKLPEITPTLRFFATRTAIDALNGVRLKIESTGVLPAEINFGGQYAPRAVLAVCEHLAECWAPVPPMRGHPRRKVKSWLTVINGFERICRRLVGQEANAAGDESWVAEDVSLNGIGASVNLIGKEWLKVGGLVGMQPEGGGNWLVGIVRRIVRESESLANVGLETLSKNARVTAADSGGRRIEVLVLDPLAKNSEVRVVMADIAWDARIPLVLDGVAARLDPVGQADAGASYVVGRYKVT